MLDLVQVVPELLEGLHDLLREHARRAEGDPRRCERDVCVVTMLEQLHCCVEDPHGEVVPALALEVGHGVQPRDARDERPFLSLVGWQLNELVLRVALLQEREAALAVHSLGDQAPGSLLNLHQLRNVGVLEARPSSVKVVHGRHKLGAVELRRHPRRACRRDPHVQNRQDLRPSLLQLLRALHGVPTELVLLAVGPDHGVAIQARAGLEDVDAIAPCLLSEQAPVVEGEAFSVISGRCFQVESSRGVLQSPEEPAASLETFLRLRIQAARLNYQPVARSSQHHDGDPLLRVEYFASLAQHMLVGGCHGFALRHTSKRCWPEG
mmetsp:Transcript_66803/g.168686  ORF Transcript_66803/g.168686 Transcript_66803/m.168686 type:complete len:323 (+) Transcript_66803:928-1896(+)